MEDQMPINNWMPVYTRDILASCADMSATQFGAYMRLLLWAWDSGGLPNDMEACCRIAGGLAPSDWAVVRKRLVVIDAGTSEERLSHPRLEQERAKAQQGYDRKVAAISKARAARAANTDHNTDDSTDDSIDHSTVNSPVNKTQPQPQPQPQPHPPINDETPSEFLGRTPKRRPPRRTYRIRWEPEAGWVGITDADIALWTETYPAVDVRGQLREMHAHWRANLAKARKSNWERSIVGWLSREQDRGGTPGFVGKSSQPAAKRRYYRSDAQQNLTDEEYARWKTGNTTLGDEIRERTRRAAGPTAE
jgi:uncharacterized protein YdaU (DUF1376 family)